MFTKSLRILLLLTFLAGSLGPFPAAAASSQPTAWQQTGQIGGPTQGIVLQGSYAYLGWGPRLVIANILDPYGPSLIGQTSPFSDQVQDVAVSGSYAYVAAGAAGLRIINIANPAAPLEIGHWESAGYAESVAILDSTVFLANGPYGLRAISVADPAHPQEVGRSYEMNYIYDVFLYSQRAYLAAGGSGLLIADISNSAAPVELGSYDTPGYAYGVQAAAGQAYVADAWGGLQIINILDAAHPSLVGALSTAEWAMELSLAGQRVYLANGAGGLNIVDASNPTHPISLGALSTRFGHAGGVAASGSIAYLADFYTGLRLISVADPAHPAQTGQLNLFSLARQIAISGSYAYVPAGYAGLRVLNIANPAQPYEEASYPMTGYAQCVQAVNNRLYIGTMPDGKYEGLHVLDISNPAAPVFLGAYYAHIECHDLEIVGTTAYIADSYGLHIVDFSNPYAPVLRGNTNPNEYTNGVAISDSLAFITLEAFLGGFDGIKVYNVANPASPILVGTFAYNHTWDILLNGSLAYVTLPGGVLILDVSNPAALVKRSEYSAAGQTFDMTLSGSLLYLGAGAGGIEAVDVSNPSAPTQAYQYNTPGYTYDLTFSDGLVWVADSEAGLLALNPAATDSAYQPPSLPAASANASPLASSPIRVFVDHSRSAASSRPAPSTGAFADHSRAAPESPAPQRAPQTCTVTSAADSGSGSLRSCLSDHVPGDVIVFSPAVFPPAAPATIRLSTDLPVLSAGGLTIDASNAGVIIDGSNINNISPCGLNIYSNGNIIRGLQVINFQSSGIIVRGSNNIIGGSRLVGSGPTGQGNVFSDNTILGININDPDDIVTPTANVIQGNIIGLNAAGNAVLGSQGAGLFIRNGQYNIIGSLEPGKNNIISGHQGMGIETYGTSTTGNQFLGNYVGTDLSGSFAIGNGNAGITIWVGSNHTLLQGNLSSGNSVGILIFDPSSDYNTLIGNKVGVDISGSKLLPNRELGIRFGWSGFSRIGGAAPGEANIIGDAQGITVWSPRSANNLILGNQFGLNLAPPADPVYGWNITLDGAARTVVGGLTAAERNTILSDRDFGMVISADHTFVLGNDFGLLPNGSAALRQANTHIWVRAYRPIIQGNRMANAIQRAVMVGDNLNATMRRNIVYNNGLAGYSSDQPMPSLSLDDAGGSGTACPFCTIELYLDNGNQGRLYLDTLTADASGAFSFHKYCPLAYPNLTATAAGPIGGTSYFAGPWNPPWDCSTPRPAPAISALSLSQVQAPSSTLLLAVDGANFAPDSVVRWNGAAVQTRYVSASQLVAVLPSSLLRSGGAFSITVSTPAPGGGTSAASTFTVLPPLRIFIVLVRR